MNKISEYRKHRKISQKKLADDLNVSTATVGMWEIDKRTPSLNTAYKIALYFNTSIEDIFFNL